MNQIVEVKYKVKEFKITWDDGSKPRRNWKGFVIDKDLNISKSSLKRTTTAKKIMFELGNEKIDCKRTKGTITFTSEDKAKFSFLTSKEENETLIENIVKAIEQKEQYKITSNLKDAFKAFANRTGQSKTYIDGSAEIFKEYCDHIEAFADVEIPYHEKGTFFTNSEIKQMFDEKTWNEMLLHCHDKYAIVEMRCPRLEVIFSKIGALRGRSFEIGEVKQYWFSGLSHYVETFIGMRPHSKKYKKMVISKVIKYGDKEFVYDTGDSRVVNGIFIDYLRKEFEFPFDVVYVDRWGKNFRDRFKISITADQEEEDEYDSE